MRLVAISVNMSATILVLAPTLAPVTKDTNWRIMDTLVQVLFLLFVMFKLM